MVALFDLHQHEHLVLFLTLQRAVLGVRVVTHGAQLPSLHTLTLIILDDLMLVLINLKLDVFLFLGHGWSIQRMRRGMELMQTDPLLALNERVELALPQVVRDKGWSKIVAVKVEGQDAAIHIQQHAYDRARHEAHC